MIIFEYKIFNKIMIHINISMSMYYSNLKIKIYENCFTSISKYIRFFTPLPHLSFSLQIIDGHFRMRGSMSTIFSQHFYNKS